ncbi:hypothetical protein [Pseudonocardia sp. ICBG1293]|uniref:hypothetical protein n=1 Tax=Pseudonocardia sp. ICBG1293 TaxID=2844382 RepID=UPI001CCC25E0|nr:hypothetical protein [Pseudonocardia sp. ICBG1293]
MEHDRNTPGPEGPATRRVVAWVLIIALAGLPLSYLAGTAGSQVVLALVVVVALLVGGVAFWLHRRTR